MTTQRHLTVKNFLSYPIWIEFDQPDTETPPPWKNQIIKIVPQGNYTYDIPDVGLRSARWWVKTGCDSDGKNCLFGNSKTYDLEKGAQPPLESKLEATYDDISKENGQDYFNTSLVDGYTLPFQLIVKTPGQEVDKICDGGNTKWKGVIDCSGLSLEKCPNDKICTDDEDCNLDLKYTDPQTGNTLACFSPCKKLVSDIQQQGKGKHEKDNIYAFHMCCPGPTSPEGCAVGTCCNFKDNECLPSTGSFPKDCPCQMDNFCACCCSCNSDNPAVNKYPVTKTNYVKYVHDTCPTYAWAYDDAVSLHHCPSNSKFNLEWIFTDTPRPDPSPDPTPDPSPDPSPGKTFFWLYIVFGVILFIVCLLVLIVLLVRSRHRKPSKKSKGIKY